MGLQEQELVEVTFSAPGKLGISFAAAGPEATPVVKAVKPDGLAAQYSSRLVPGLVLHAVNGQNVAGYTFEQALGLVTDATRPATLAFQADTDAATGALGSQSQLAQVNSPIFRTDSEQLGEIKGSDLEAALAMSLLDELQPQTVESLEKLMAVRQAELTARLEAKLQAIVQATAPVMSLHQAAVKFACDAGSERRGAGYTDIAEYATEVMAGVARRRLRNRSVLVSALMVLAQSVVVLSIWHDTLSPVCSSNDQCQQKGTFCLVGGSNRCWYCGNSVPLLAQRDLKAEGVLNRPDHKRYVGFNRTLLKEVCGAPAELSAVSMRMIQADYTRAGAVSWCEACVRNDGMVDELTATSHAGANVAAMGYFDWLALVTCTTVLALSVGGELQVSMSVAHTVCSDCPVSWWRGWLAVVTSNPLVPFHFAGYQAVHRGDRSCWQPPCPCLAQYTVVDQRCAALDVPPDNGLCGASPSAVSRRRGTIRVFQYCRATVCLPH